MTDPHYPKIILSFAYRNCKIEIDRDKFDGQYIYAAWVNYDRGCVVAVPGVMNTKDAVRKAKRWVDLNLG